MIKAYIGADTQKAREVLALRISEAQVKNPEALLARFNDVTFDLQAVTEALTAENLFGGGNILVLDGVLDHPDGTNFYRNILKKTANTVFIRETEPSKEVISALKKVADVEEFAAIKKIEKRENSFAIADAIAAKDKKAAWVEFEKARRRGAAAEEVHGTIFWAFKTLYIVATVSKEEAIAAGVKEFTYRNYRLGSTKYLAADLAEKLRVLKDMYHQAHRGEADLEVALEQFVLAL